MKGLKARASAILATALLAAVIAGPAAAGAGTVAGPEPPGLAYRPDVACGLARKAPPAHLCPKGSKKGAFFKSLKANVAYTVCVKFPSGKNLCAKAQEAKEGTLYVNKVTSTIAGRHVVSWFVKGKKVGSFAFRVKA